SYECSVVYCSSNVAQFIRITILLLMLLFFFFQAEDGIRDRNVTGVQTCALPISAALRFLDHPVLARAVRWRRDRAVPGRDAGPRSEERRVGKEGRYRWATSQQKKKDKRMLVRQRHELVDGRERWTSGGVILDARW